jgi:hypothetical protein
VPELTAPRRPELTLQQEQEIIERCLMITHSSVVDDNRAKALGPWSFESLITEMVNEKVTGIEPRKFVENWLDAVGEELSSVAFAAWDTLSNRQRTLETLPFRLLAIVNRIDLRNNLVLGGTGAGEMRFVFGVIDAFSGKFDATVIFEYSIKRTQLDDIREWGRQRYGLKDTPVTDPRYNAALQAVTYQYTRRGADPNGGSALGQVRISSRAGRSWQFGEFQLDVARTRSLLRVKTQQTPDTRFDGDRQLMRAFRQEYKSDILARRHRVPERYQSQDFLATRPLISGERPPPFFWSGEDLPADLLEARHLFSLNTCTACHAAETATDFFHVGPRDVGAAAPLSRFLTGDGGFTVDDPAGQKDEANPANVKKRPFHDLAVRVADLQVLVEIGWAYEATRKRPNWVH